MGALKLALATLAVIWQLCLAQTQAGEDSRSCAVHDQQQQGAGAARAPCNCAYARTTMMSSSKLRTCFGEFTRLTRSHRVAPPSVKLVTPFADHVQLESPAGLIYKLGTGNATAWEAAARCNSISFPRSRGALLPSTLALRVLTDLRRQNPGIFQVCNPLHYSVTCTNAHWGIAADQLCVFPGDNTTTRRTATATR